MNIDDWDTDLIDTLTKAARWEKIAGLVASSGQEVLFDDYEIKKGRRVDGAFMLAMFEHDVKFLLDLYDFVVNEAKRKELRGIFRRLIASPSMCIEPLAKIVWPLKQRVEEYDFLAKHNCHPPDGGNDA